MERHVIDRREVSRMASRGRKQIGDVVSYLQTDEGREYEKEMTIVLKRSGTTHLTSPPYSHQSNGLAEILNQKLKDARFAHTHNCTFFENEFPSPDEFPTLQMEPRMRKRARVAVPPVSQEERQPQQ